jgi:fibro-slime domain-containing protein
MKRSITGFGVLALTAGLALPGAASADDPYAALPSQIQLVGIVRDFKARTDAGGHTDFEWAPTGGYGHYVGEVADALDTDGLPLFSSAGYKVSTEWHNSAGKNIIGPKPYLSAKSGDVAGARASTTGGSLHTADAFRQWYRDTPGMNLTSSVPITLVRQSNSNRYVFDDTIDARFHALGGFFPIDGQLYGNYGTTGHNFGFTYMIDTEFVFQRSQGQVFTFTGDDDVWVFIDGKLVIDLGGVHSAVQQTIDLDRCNWLQDGQTYSLKFFFAERHTTQADFRVETTLNLRNVQPPSTSALAD